MRLIDADKFMGILLLCQRLNKEFPLSEEKFRDETINNFEQGQSETFDLVIEQLEKQPTAFDLDKVVEQIRKATDEYGLVDYVNDKPMITKEQAIEIVKKGGIA